MAVRIIALLIPLAIILPQLQKNGPPAAAPSEQTTHPQPASPPEWSHEARRMGDAALSRVVLESPAIDAARTIGSPATGPAELAPRQPAARKPAAQCAAPKPVRVASPARVATRAAASAQAAARQAKRPPWEAGCQPSAHCAPVVMAKVTLVRQR